MSFRLNVFIILMFLSAIWIHCQQKNNNIEDIFAKKPTKRFILNDNKWSTDERLVLRYNVSIDFHNSSNSLKSEFIDLLERAAKQWTDITNISIEFDDNPRISSIFFNLIEFSFYNLTEELIRGYKLIEPKPELQTFTILINSETFINNYSNLSTNSGNLFNVLVHTFGHALSLKDSSTQTDSVMYPFIGEKFKNLSVDDIEGIQTLYGYNENNSDINYSQNRPDLSGNATDLCSDPKIDSALELPNKRWILLKGQHYYEIGPFGQTLNSPRRIIWDFKEVEPPIDATLNWSENIIFFFKRNEYWKYRNQTFISRRKISQGFKGIPDGPFDDIFKWNVNQKTYFFRGNKFWKYDSKTKKVGTGYPKFINQYWKGVPDSVDAALSSGQRNQTYFFKGDKYYRFDDRNKSVVESMPPFPRETKIWFLKCRLLTNMRGPSLPTPPPIRQMQTTSTPQTNQILQKEQNNEGEAWLLVITIILVLLLLIILGTALYAVLLTCILNIN